MASTWRVGAYYKVTLAIDRKPEGEALGNIRAWWSPTMPRRLTGAEEAAYVAGRDAFFQEIAAEMGASWWSPTPRRSHDRPSPTSCLSSRGSFQ